jgi:hypothetical protein
MIAPVRQFNSRQPGLTGGVAFWKLAQAPPVSKFHGALFMRANGLLITATAFLLLIAPPANAAETAPPPLQNLRNFTPPIVVQNAEVLQDGHTIEIELTDAGHHTLILDMGATRLPGSMLEMFAGVPEQEITLRSSPGATNTAPLKPGGPDEQLVYKLLLRWKTSGSAMGTVKGGKRLAPPPNIAAERRRLTGKVIATLKARNR